MILAFEALETRHQRAYIVNHFCWILTQGCANHYGGRQRRSVFPKLQESYVLLAVAAQVRYLPLAQLKLSPKLSNYGRERRPYDGVLGVRLLGRFGILLRHNRPNSGIL